MKTGTGDRGPGTGISLKATVAPIDRYVRQVGVPGIGEAGQARLATARVVVLGAGGLGFPVLTYLAAAGVGSVVIVDRDTVEPSNLNRQCLFTESDLGRPKAEVAARRLAALDSAIRFEPVGAALTEANAAGLLAGADLAIDCADNWEARAVLATAAWRAGVLLIHGAVASWDGTVATFAGRSSPCFRCVYPEPLQEEAPPSVLGAVAGVVGSLMAAEAVRVLCGARALAPGELLLLDVERTTLHRVTAPALPDCPLCGGAAVPSSER